jgi:ATP-binding cassette subfamily B protein
LQISLLARLPPYLRASRVALSAFIASLLIAAGASTAVPLIFRRVVDEGLVPGRPPVAVLWTAVALSSSLTAAAATSLSGALGSRIGADLTYRLRRHLHAHLSRQSLSFYAQSRSGALASRITNDAVDAQTVVQGVLGTVVGHGFTFAVSVTAMILLDPVVAVLTLLGTPLFLLPVRLAGRRLRAAGNRQAAARADLHQHLSEHLNSAGALARAVFGSRDRERAVFDRISVEHRRAVVARNAYFHTSAFFLSALAGVGVATVYWVASIRADQEISIGTVVALAGLVSLVYQPLIQLATQGLGLTGALVALERVFEVLDHGEQYDPPGTIRLRRPVRTLTLDHVWFSHPGREVALDSAAEDFEGAPDGDRETPWAVTDLALQLKPGVTALVGASGAGKTTTALLACGVYSPSRGAVRVDGAALDDLHPDQRARIFGVITQDAFLLHASLRENVRLADPSAPDEQIKDALRRAELGALISTLPDCLDTMVGDRGYRLSGGERQRLSIARVLLARPDIVIMDEPTAHLDTVTERAVSSALDQHLPNAIRLVIAHRLTTIRRADQIVVLAQGRIVQRGTHDTLAGSEGHYARLIGALT